MTTTPQEKQELIEFWSRKLEKFNADAETVSRGRLVFQERGSNCHQMFGVGGTTGPDLTGSNRNNLNYLLSNIIAPSSSVAESYRSTIFELVDGRLISGLVIEETSQTIRVQMPTEIVSIDRDTIEAMRRSDKSVMPDGLLNDMSDEQVRALAAYMDADRQVPLPSGRN